jgi:hypothetical protein
MVSCRLMSSKPRTNRSLNQLSMVYSGFGPKYLIVGVLVLFGHKEKARGLLP